MSLELIRLLQADAADAFTHPLTLSGVLHQFEDVIAAVLEHVCLQLLLGQEDDVGALLAACQASPGQERVYAGGQVD